MYVNVGIDIGSTTVKIVVVRDGEIIHKHYERHFSKVREKAVELVRAARTSSTAFSRTLEKCRS